jgi:hypothetical protein
MSQSNRNPWTFFLKGLAISCLVFFFLSNLPLLIKAGLYFLGVAFFNKYEDRKFLRLGYAIGVGLVIFLFANVLGRLPYIGEALMALPGLAVFWLPLVYHLLPNAVDGSLNTNRKDRPFSLTEMVLTIACAVAVIVILVVCMLNAKPWVELADTIVKVLTDGSGFKSFILLTPLKTIYEFLPIIIGGSLWAFCQMIQILPLVLETDPVLGNKLKNAAKGNEFVKKALANLGLVRTLAYIFEIGICFASMPPYAGGWAAIAKDAPNFDADKIDWMLLLFIIPLTVWGMEALAKVTISLFALRKAATSPAHA